MPRFFLHTTTNPKSMNPKQKSSPTTTATALASTAAKHFDYDTSTSPSPSSSSSATRASSRVSALKDPNCSLHSRSLDIDLQTIFRVEGSEGEIEFMIKNLGLSGIEDFSIPVDAWESWKIRSVSDVLPGSQLTWEGSSWKENGKESDELVGARVLTEVTGTRGGWAVENPGRFDVVESRSRERNYLGCGMNGIRGSRPPMLRPPPSMRLPAIDNTVSISDLLRDLL